MKFRNQFLKYQLHSNTEGDGGGGGDTGGGDTNTGGNEGDQNNDGDNTQTFDDLWHTNNESNANAGQNADQNTNQQTQQKPSAEEAFNQHLQSLDLNFDTTAYHTALQAGDFEGANAMQLEHSQKIYKQAMVNLNKVINTRIEQSQTQMQQDTQSTLQSTTVINKMHEALPFTKSKANAPIAQAVLKQMLQNGKSPEDAITATGDYFKSLAGQVSETLQIPPKNRQKGRFTNGVYVEDTTGNNDEGNGAPDWVEFLSGT